MGSKGRSVRSVALVALVTAAVACSDKSDPGNGAGTDAGAGVTPDASDPGAVPRVEPAACRFQVAASLGLSEGADYECGDLIVYENRDAPDVTIRLHYIRFHSASAGPDATIYLDGGPGGNGQDILDYAGYLGMPFLEGLMSAGDFLVIAQRGTSLSMPDLSQDTGGADLPSYNTAFNADDVDDLRAALGYDKLNLYGISYGSRLGLEVLRRHGDNIRAASIGGIVPAQVNWPAAIPASFYHSLTGLNRSCGDVGGCRTAYGDLESKFVQAYGALNDRPVSISTKSGPVSVTGDDFAGLLFSLLYSRSIYPYLPLMISDLAARRTDRIGAVLGSIIDQQSGGDGGVSLGLYYSVVCGELFNPPDPSAFDSANAEVPADIRDIYGASWTGLLNFCPTWDLGDPRPELGQPVSSGVRTLINSGAIDPITPSPFADIAAQSLSDSVEVLYANSGHGATLQSDCGQQILFAFLNDPGATPSTACASQITTDYVLPQALRARPVPLERVILEMRMTGAPPLLGLARAAARSRR